MPESRDVASVRSWVAWSIVGAAYIVAFFQRVAPPIVVDRLMATFDVGAGQIGILTSAYFYGYMVMQFPAGIMVDTWGVRRTVLGSLAMSAIGVFWFAWAGGLVEATAARALIALGDALIFSALMKVVAQRFPARRFGLMAGLSQLLGYVGGLLATTPLALLVGAVGWRGAFQVIAAVVSATLIVAFLWLRDDPGPRSGQAQTLGANLREAARALRRRQAWGPALTFSGTYVASVSLSGVWGIPYLMQIYGLSRSSASVPMFMFMAGYALGAVAFGYLSDVHFRTLRRPALFSAFARIGLLLLLTPAVGHSLGLVFLTACLAVLGFLSGGMIPLVLTGLKLTYSSSHIGAGLGVNAAIGGLASGLIQPVLGAILEMHWAGNMLEGARVYSADGYMWLLVVLAGTTVMSVIGPILSVDKDVKTRDDLL